MKFMMPDCLLGIVRAVTFAWLTWTLKENKAIVGSPF